MLVTSRVFSVVWSIFAVALLEDQLISAVLVLGESSTHTVAFWMSDTQLCVDAFK